MAKSRRRFTAEFRHQMVEQARAGRSPEALARQYQVSSQSIRNWVRQAGMDEGRRSDGVTTDERAELQRLRRENDRLREERDILKKAAAWFAQETGTIRGGSSNS